MTKHFPAPPTNTQPLAVTRPNADVRAFLAHRRSASKRHLTDPGPSAEELDELLTVAARVPDHRKLGPWRYIIFDGDARVAFGETLARIFEAQNPAASEAQLAEERARFLRAPSVVVVVSSPKNDGRTPIWEQELSAGALCYNLTLAASAAGWACVWLSEWLAFDIQVAAEMGLTGEERIAGVMYLGTSTMDNPERPRPNMTERITRWKV